MLNKRQIPIGTRRATIIASLDKADLRAFFDTYISPSSAERAKLAILYRSQRLQPGALDALLEVTERLASRKLEGAKELVANKPTFEQVEAFIGGLDLDPAARSEFDRVLVDLRTLPPLPAGTEEIRADQASVDAFRKSLPRADRYRPALSLDLPVEPCRL